jgi:transcriptional regulator with XRE-family HTH domain
VPSAKTYQAICAEIVRLLREEIKRQGLSVYALAKISGLTQPAIGYVEKELRIPSLETVLRMSDGLKIDLEDVIKQARKTVLPKKPGK